MEQTIKPDAAEGSTEPSGKRPERRRRKANKKTAAARSKTATTSAASSTASEAEQPDQPAVRPVAGPARMRMRHLGLIASFLLMVVLPATVTLWYLEQRAADQYASTIGFSVRAEEASSAMDFLGGITGVSSGSSSDTDILYEFIQSQKMVELVNQRLDLRQIYSKPDNDPVFAFQADGSIEDLVSYWSRMVKIYYEASTGLIEIRVTAFAPQDAQDIAKAILEESSRMINQLSAVARDDATKYAKRELAASVERLKHARQAVTEFRNRAQIVDPNADIQGQMGLLNNLHQQLAAAIIESDLLKENARENDPRADQAARRIAVIESRIAEERKKLGVGSGDGDGAYATLINEYEALSVDREFAEKTYLSALTAHDAALAEAQHQSRYLAAYVEPTLAETPQYPERLTLFGIVTVFLFMIWGILALVAYSIKDRR